MYLTALLLSVTLLALTTAAVNDKCDCTRGKPTPTLPFTLAAFQSPYPPGSNATGSYGVSGVKISAYAGSLWVNRLDERPKSGCAGLRGRDCPVGNETVVWVDERGGAWLDSADPQPIFLNTRTGALSYLHSGITTFPAGSNTVNFLHLGEGTSITSPLPGFSPPVGFFNAGPGSFEWNGGGNGYWVLCPQDVLGGRSEGSEKGGGYQVMKVVGGKGDWSKCLFGIQLVALDFFGKSPAAGEYL